MPPKCTGGVVQVTERVCVYNVYSAGTADTNASITSDYNIGWALNLY